MRFGVFVESKKAAALEVLKKRPSLAKEVRHESLLRDSWFHIPARDKHIAVFLVHRSLARIGQRHL